MRVSPTLVTPFVLVVLLGSQPAIAAAKPPRLTAADYQRAELWLRDRVV
jgi:hypothetical protein